MIRFFTWWVLLIRGGLYLKKSKRYSSLFDRTGRVEYLEIGMGYSNASVSIAEKLEGLYPE